MLPAFWLQKRRSARKRYEIGMRSLAIHVLAATLATAGCSFGESGVSPPLDHIFLPGGAAIDPDGRFLYVVNSNSDLRYNAGTLVGIDLDTAREDRAPGREWPACPTPGYVGSKTGVARTCCRDYFDAEILNCDERGYIDSRQTVQLGSFGSTMIIGRQPGQPAESRRLYVAVRAEPSITFVDTTVSAGGVSFRCSEQGGQNHLCDNTHKVLGETEVERGPRLAEEPHNLVFDEKLQLLYVSHAAESVSVVDTCPTKPALVSVRTPVFEVPGQWVTSLLLSDPGKSEGEIFATGRNYFGAQFGSGAAQIRSLFLRGGDTACQGEARKGVELVPGTGFYSSALFSSGTDIRGMLLSPDKRTAFVLHRNGASRDNPPAVVAIDRSSNAAGQPSNRAIGLVETCSGATRMRWHDAGRGPHILVVCFESGQVYVIEPQRLTVAAVINTGRGPNELAFSEKEPQVAYVTGFGDNNVSVVDLQPGSRTEYKVIQRIGYPHVGAR